jgi:hypothetical protein
VSRSVPSPPFAVSPDSSGAFRALRQASTLRVQNQTEMRRKVAVMLAFAASASLLPSTSAQAGPTGCRVATMGMDRPEWFCEFYAAGPLDYTVAGISGWAIDRLVRQNNDGTLVYERLAGKPATNYQSPPVDVSTGTVSAQAGWRIRVQVLASFTASPPPGPPVLAYRNGFIDVQS